MRIVRSTLTVAAALATVTAARGIPTARADDPAVGATTYFTYETFMSPAQEPGEESETPKAAQKVFGATKPSTARARRASRGFARVRFQRDLARAVLELELKGIDPLDIVAVQVQCGAPDGVGPSLVDVGKLLDLGKALHGGKLSVQIGLDAVATTQVWPAGLPFRITESCPVEPGTPATVTTIAGMERLARRGLLYVNVRTKAHLFFGEIRGQLFIDQ
ncbi:MAG: CHRD domain-containing protein [Deltaproteobacteria bacterium]|nr:CHRD domain-containing protein [Deltaproteobacteria bacterium]